MIVLETPRLILRHFESGDLDPLFALYRDPQMRRYFPEGTRTRAETEEELEWFRDGHPDDSRLGLWATVERSTGSFLGRCGLLPWTIDGQSEVELAFLIDKARWGEGFATEAALGIVDHARQILRLERLICLIMHGNDASVRVAEKAGMRHERDHAGEFGPCLVYSQSLALKP